MFTPTHKRLALGFPIAILMLVACMALDSAFSLEADGTRMGFTTSELQRAIELQDESQLNRAIAAWKDVDLAEDREIWRHIALAVAHLYEYRYDDAETELEAALEYNFENAAVHYFKGLLCLMRAEFLDECSDLAGRDDAGLSKAMHRLRFSHTKSRYQRDAMGALEKAIEYQVSSQNAILLVAGETTTAGDLLDVLGADNFVGKAHGLLAHLNLEQGLPERAEHHLDEAQTLGIPVPYGYRLAGERYEALGRTDDAHRAFAKATRNGDVLASPQAIEAKIAELFRYRLTARRR